MSGTSASISTSGGITLPEPVIRIQPQGEQAGRHDIVHVGGLLDSQFEQIAELNPRIWLFRYKRGYNPQIPPPAGYNYDNTRGYVHPSNWINSGATVRQHIGGGQHNSRSGSSIPDRQSEWALTAAHKYDAVFNAELWFLDVNAKAQAWPIQPLVGGNVTDYGKVGLSGQSNSNTHSYPDHAKPMFCNSTRTKGVQVQTFRFAVVCDNPKDDRNPLIGPMSGDIRAEIWPRVRVSFDQCGANSDLGRKIRVTMR